MRKAMGYHDLLRRVLEQPLERKPVLHDTVYVRDMDGMMEAGVVLACADNGTYGVAIAARGQDLKHDLSYPDAGLDTARSFDPSTGVGPYISTTWWRSWAGCARNRGTPCTRCP